MVSNYSTAHAVDQIDIEKLHKNGKRFIIIDLDNTIARWRTFVIKDAVKLWLGKAKQLGFDICILSNNHNRERTKDIAQLLGIKAVQAHNKKPNKKSYAEALEFMKAKKDAAVMIGDQLYSDIRGALKAGIDGILVDPIYKTEAPITKILRIWERLCGRRIKWQDR